MMSDKPFYEQNGGNLSKSPPDYLGKTAQEAWKRIVPFLLSTGRVERIDTTLVEQYCTTYETYRQAYEDVKTNGAVIAPPPEPLISPTGEQVGEKYIFPRRNPAQAIMQSSSDKLLQIGSKLGLTPKDRQKLFELADKNKKEESISEMAKKSGLV